MNTFDIIILALLLFGFIRGLFKGLFIEIASLVALITGVYGAIHFSYFVGNFLANRVSWDEKFVTIISFSITFGIIVLVISLIGKLFTKIADFASLGLLNKILDAPVGQVVTVLGEALNCNIKLQVVEQNKNSSGQFVRNISISAQEFPVIKANAKFDSTVLPEVIITDLLKKKRGIGTILNMNNIKATRKMLSLNQDENSASREYQIIHNEVVWFTIIEKIKLGSLGSYNNR